MYVVVVPLNYRYAQISVESVRIYWVNWWLAVHSPPLPVARKKNVIIHPAEQAWAEFAAPTMVRAFMWRNAVRDLLAAHSYVRAK